ncbi:hypothetical protein MC885_012137 [Smutsia gigantea]|nr:hypothetical protein MC885_012137 [Smutsia gigantea]
MLGLGLGELLGAASFQLALGHVLAWTGITRGCLRLAPLLSQAVRNPRTCAGFGQMESSLRSNQGFMHMKLAKTKEKYVLGQNSPPFDSVPEVIHYYTTRKLPIKGAEHLSLLYPVAVRTL